MKIKCLTALVFGLVMSGLFSSCALTISGTLKEPGGDAVYSPDARINVVKLDPDSATEQVVEVLEVEKSGTFTTKAGLSEGSYLVEALVPGYKSASVRLQVDSSKDVALTCTPLAAVATPSFDANLRLDMSRGQGGATLTPPRL